MCGKLYVKRCSRRLLIRHLIGMVIMLLMALSEPAHGQVTIFTEAFEGTFPGSTWTVGDLDTDFGLDYWGRVTCRRHNGSYSVWCATVGATKDRLCSDYDMLMEAYMDSPVIPLSFPDGSPMYTDVELSFWTWIENYAVTGYPDDGLWVYARESGGAWQLLINFTVEVHDWTKTTLDVSSYDDIQLRFRFKSYNSARPAMEGAYVDDVLITGCPILTAPTPIYPLLKDPVCGDRYITYRWSEVPNASSYTISWYDDPPEVSPPIDSALATGTNYTRILPGSGTRYWRVRANGPCEDGPWSSSTRFYLYPTPSQVSLLTPQNGSDVCLNLSQRYTWTTAADATTYRVQFDQSSSFSSPIVNIATTNYLDRILTGSGVWYWRVRGETSHCDGDWSATGHFTVPAPLAAPTLDSPVNREAVCTGDNPFTFSWNAVQYAIGYLIEADTDPSFASPVYDYTGSSETSAFLNLPTTTTWHWRVRALGTCGNGPWSAVREVIVLADPSNVILTAPAEGATLGRTHPTAFRWIAETNVVFNIEWADNPEFTAAEQTYSVAPEVSWTPLHNGVWHWRVRPENYCGAGTWVSRSFTVQDDFEPVVIDSFSSQPNGMVQLDWLDPGLLLNYSVVYRTNLMTGADWAPLPPAAQWPVTTTTWSGETPAADTPLYLRIRCD